MSRSRQSSVTDSNWSIEPASPADSELSPSRSSLDTEPTTVAASPGTGSTTSASDEDPAAAQWSRHLRDWLQNLADSHDPKTQRLLMLEHDPWDDDPDIESKVLYYGEDFINASSIIKAPESTDGDALFYKWMNRPGSTLWLIRMYPEEYLFAASMTMWTKPHLMKRPWRRVEDHYYFGDVDGNRVADVHHGDRTYLRNETRKAVEKALRTTMQRGNKSLMGGDLIRWDSAEAHCRMQASELP